MCCAAFWRTMMWFALSLDKARVEAVARIEAAATVEAVYHPPSHCPAVHCLRRHRIIYVLCQYLAAGALIRKKKRVWSICVTLLFSDMLGVSRESHTNPPCWCPFLQVLMGAQARSWKANPCTIRLQNNKQSHRKQLRCVCQMQTSGSG